MNKIDVYKLGEYGWRCAVKLGHTEYVLSVQDWYDLAQNIIEEVKPHLSSAIHADGDTGPVCKLCGYDHLGINCNDYQ